MLVVFICSGISISVLGENHNYTYMQNVTSLFSRGLRPPDPPISRTPAFVEIWIWAQRYHISGEAGGRLIWGTRGAEPPSEYPITIIRFLRVNVVFVL